MKEPDLDEQRKDIEINNLVDKKVEEERDIYIEKLSKKEPMFMERFELEDWLDHIIYDKMQFHTFNDIQKDTFNHILYYFRLMHFEIHKIEARADNNHFMLKSFLLLLKENNPKMVDTILEMTQNMMDERNKELVKDETPEDAQRIIDRAKELQEEFKKSQKE